MIISLAACGQDDRERITSYDSETVIIAKTMKNILSEYEKINMTIINYTDNSHVIESEDDLQYIANVIISDDKGQMYMDNIDGILYLSTSGKTLTYGQDYGFEVVSEAAVDFVSDIIIPYKTMLTWVIDNPNKFSYSKTVSDTYEIYGIIVEDIPFFSNKYLDEIGTTSFEQVDGGMNLQFYMDGDFLIAIEWNMTINSELYTSYTYFYDSPDIGYEEIGNNAVNIWNYTDEVIDGYENRVIFGN